MNKQSLSEVRRQRHLRQHPNDIQSAERRKPATAGQSHTRVSQFMAKLNRAVKTGAFGPGKPRTPEQKLADKAAKLGVTIEELQAA